MSRIIILSGEIRSGKTTALMEWCRGKDDIGGYLTPDSGGIRTLYDIKEQAWHPFEVQENTASTKTISIGKFEFYAAAFDKMRAMVERDISGRVQWIIIDEVGKLEAKGEGAHKLVLDCLIQMEDSKNKVNLILVVRSELLKIVLEKYDLGDSEVIDKKQIGLLD